MGEPLINITITIPIGLSIVFAVLYVIYAIKSIL